MKNIALVHDWLLNPGGAERVLSAIQQLFDADLFTLFSNKPSQKTHTSFLNKLPWVEHYYKSLLPLFPFAIESFDLSEFDVVLSSSHAVANKVKTRHDQTHICYCHTPMRYLWDLQDHYINSISSSWKQRIAKVCLKRLQKWDLKTKDRPDVMIANSKTVANRIERIYGRKTDHIIYPPVDTQKFALNEKKRNYFVTHSRLVSYKRLDLIVKAFAHLPDETLVVIGEGPQFSQLRSIAKPNVHFVGRCSEEQVVKLVGGAKGYLYAAFEDFGIAPVEAMSCGTPVIALGKGGTSETVIDSKTGLHFQQQTLKSLLETINRFLKIQGSFDYTLISEHAKHYCKERFMSEYQAVVEAQLCVR